MSDTYEVELKFRLEQMELLETRLRKGGAVEHQIVLHVDRYFNHPARDFRSTDEAFRIRSVGEDNSVTYKGPVLGTVAKSRHEIEIRFESGSDAARQFFEMAQMLGFRFVREVRKSRRSFSLSWRKANFELAIDDVPGIGCFLEIELIAAGSLREMAEKAVWDLAHELGMSVAEPRSYLDLLLEMDGTTR